MPETLANAVSDMLFSSNWTELVINKNNSHFTIKNVCYTITSTAIFDFLIF